MAVMATPAGLEPALSGVTGRHFNLLNYGAIFGDPAGARTRTLQDENLMC